MKRKIFTAAILSLLVMLLFAGAALAGGNCGPESDPASVQWEYDGLYTLTISGSGPMANYSQMSDTPWGSSGVYYPITAILIEDGVTGIGNNAFANFPNLETVSGMQDVKEIGEHAFYKCAKLENIPFREGLEYIGYEAFLGCDALTEAALPDTLKTIGYGAFYGCDKLATVKIGAGITAFDGSAFTACGVETLLLDDGLKYIGANAFLNCTKLTTVTLPGKLVSIGENAFDGCSELTKVTISKTAGSLNVGNGVFSGCNKLRNVDYKGHILNWNKDTKIWKLSGDITVNLLESYTGWDEEDGSKYYYKNNEMLKGEWLKLNKNWYYLQSNGTAASGISIAKWNNKSQVYYFDPETNVMQRDCDIEIAGLDRYFTTSGALAQGWAKRDGVWHYYDEDALVVKNTVVYDEDTRKMYGIDENGCLVGLGVHTFEITTQSGTVKATIYTGSYGCMKEFTGWKKWQGEWYYFVNGVAKCNTYLEEEDTHKIYWFDEDGKMVTNDWIEVVEGSKLYFGKYGAAYTGWLKQDGEWYYLRSGAMTRDDFVDDKYWFDENGVMASAEWVTIEEKSYYFKENGCIADGWTLIDGGWYYIENGSDIATGWFTDPDTGKEYYLGDDGRMWVNTTKDGKELGKYGAVK